MLQAKYTWRPEDEPRARTAFFEAAPKLYKGMMKNARDGALAHIGTGSLLDCLEEGRPAWIRSDIWERLVREHWATDRFQALSETNKKNRLTEKDGSITRHVGGSVSLEIHERRMVCFY